MSIHSGLRCMASAMAGTLPRALPHMMIASRPLWRTRQSPDLRAYVVGFTGTDTARNPPPIKLEEIDNIPDQQLPPGMKLSLKMSLRRFGVDSIQAWLERLREFQIGDALRNIRCPSLALVGEAEGWSRWICSRASVGASVDL